MLSGMKGQNVDVKKGSIYVGDIWNNRAWGVLNHIIPHKRFSGNLESVRNRLAIPQAIK